MLASLAQLAISAVPSCTAHPERCFGLPTPAGPAAMPAVALGTWRGSYKECIGDDYKCVREKAKDAVKSWIELGGDHIDGANDYRTQVEIGEVIASQPRESLFITTKCPGAIGMTATVQCAEDNLQMLGQYGVNTSGYMDLLLIHFPMVIKPECYGPSDDPTCAESAFYDPGTAARQETWQAMELLQRQGKAKAIGISDYNTTHVQETLDVATVPVALHQVEWNPLNHDEEMLALCQQNKIQLQAWSPLGGSEGDVLGNPTIKSIASAHNTSTAQVVLKWSLQRGVAVVTGTDNPAHMASDLDLWSFTLSDEEVDEINHLQSVTKVAA